MKIFESCKIQFTQKLTAINCKIIFSTKNIESDNVLEPFEDQVFPQGKTLVNFLKSFINQTFHLAIIKYKEDKNYGTQLEFSFVFSHSLYKNNGDQSAVLPFAHLSMKTHPQEHLVKTLEL